MAYEGIFDKASGKIKETAGKLTDDKNLEAEGKLQNLEGKVKDAAHDATEKATDFAEDVKAGAGAVADRVKEALKKDDE